MLFFSGCDAKQTCTVQNELQIVTAGYWCIIQVQVCVCLPPRV